MDSYSYKFPIIGKQVAIIPSGYHSNSIPVKDTLNFRFKRLNPEKNSASIGHYRNAISIIRWNFSQNLKNFFEETKEQPKISQN